VCVYIIMCVYMCLSVYVYMVRVRVCGYMRCACMYVCVGEIDSVHNYACMCVGDR